MSITWEMEMEEREAKTAPEARWQLDRAGLLNFWHYDEEEFQLEQGRLILRGSNGSGKSVTMQSFLPLVLDGDKRAHRLDPFGSRDRRIEYYLLGEDDGGKGKSDSTGYLWLEFKHTGTGLHKSIGIGLRARRNAAQVQFWGFVLEDGRRIGRDIWLYDRNRWLEDKKRVPYDRKELEEAIKKGGQVVQDQKSYQDLVNKHIFGFSDVDAFQDLLQLMLQLRSPKLSKDFKPTAIYDILHQALPPLMEEELSPLSEVLEDMDQLTDRLDEIKRQRGEVAKLQERYDTYNKYMLLVKAEEAQTVKAAYDEAAAKVSESEAKLKQAEHEKNEAELDRKAITDHMLRISAEREVLEQHEAIGKQKEYEAAVAALEDMDKQLERSSEKLRRDQMKLDRIRRELEEAEGVQIKAEREQRDLLDELEGMAGDAEFGEHGVYHRYWSAGVPDADAWREPWRNDIRLHREKVELALAKAAGEREAASMAKEREIELGEASLARDSAERSRNEKERLLEGQKEALKEGLRVWQSGLTQLSFDVDDLGATFGTIREIGVDQPTFEPVREMLLHRYAADREKLLEQKLAIEKQREGLLVNRQQLEQEKSRWEHNRHPEPSRSQAKANYREQHSNSGAPLYTVCDFQAHIPEEMRARVEDALERSGLLDAWISPDGRMGACANGQEEVWIAPNPIAFGYTLADILKADLPADSALTSENVDHVLRSFLWDEDGGLLQENEWCGIVAGDGSYRLGSLVGSAKSKTRAEFIGRETRRRTRELEIAKLKESIAQLDEQLADLLQQMQAVADKELTLTAEREAFPDSKALMESLRELQEAGYHLQALLAQEERALERFKAKSEEWRAIQRELYELTAGWTTLKRERQLSEALKTIREYEAALSELASAWRQHQDSMAAVSRMQEERQTIVLEIEDEEQLSDELDAKRRLQRAQTEALKSVIAELGLADVARRLEELRAEAALLSKRDQEQQERLDEWKEQAARASAQLELLVVEVTKQQVALMAAAQQLQGELRRGLVKEWKESAADLTMEETDSGRLQALAKRIKGQYESLFSRRNDENISNALLVQFNAARMLLTEFVLQTVMDEDTGRMTVVSMRNPHQPLTPQDILNELEENEIEQSALLSERDRELYEEIILRSVGKAIRQRIHRAEQWVREMNKLMSERDTSSGLRLKLDWEPKPASGEQQLDVHELVELLKRDSQVLREEEIDAMIRHFRSQIQSAKQAANEEQESLRLHLYSMLDYRNWFRFELKYRKGEQTGYRPLTDARFNVMSGGEKAMAMYIPLFAATSSRYSDARQDAPRLISLDEAFAGVDEANMRDMFKLLTDMSFDYMMTSQVLWGCYDTVPRLSIYEIYRPKDVDFVTLFRYRWNGHRKEYLEAEGTAT